MSQYVNAVYYPHHPNMMAGIYNIVIEQIFKMMNVKKGNFIEFGAWDGKHLSNCLKLFTEGWSGIFIEGDSSKFNTLVNNFKNYNNICCINRYVGHNDNDSLDTIIELSLLHLPVK